MQKIHRVRLSPEERDFLDQLTRSGRKVAAKKVTKAKALLLANESASGPGLPDPRIRGGHRHPARDPGAAAPARL